jgi:alpha-tubulin suppressor-like RCC1 family protein
VASGEWHSCALTAARGVQCWGLGGDGELGNGATVDQSTPVDAQPISDQVTQIAAARGHTCAIRASDGAIVCWGKNDNGQLGTGDLATPHYSFPVLTQPLRHGAVQVAAGGDTTCALLQNGDVYCWGDNSGGQIGQPPAVQKSAAPLLVTLDLPATSIAVGDGHACAIVNDGSMRCWGNDMSGQLGIGEVTVTREPVPVMQSYIGTPTQLALGLGVSCARFDTFGVSCWGDNLAYELDQLPPDAGTLTLEANPIAAIVGALVSEVSAYHHSVCARLTTGAIRCWGDNSSGQLGPGPAYVNPDANVVGFP